MACRLKNILRFTNVAASGTATLAHGIVLPNLQGAVPDIVFRSNGDFSIVSVDATNVTVQNNSTAVASCDVLVEHWHTYERDFGTSGGPPDTQMTPAPYIPGQAGGGTGTGFVPMAGPNLAGTTVRSGTAVLVNPLAANAADDGNPNTPKLTITGAVNAIAANPPVNAVTAEKRWVVIVAPGNYDEDVTIPSTVARIEFVAMGGVTLGDGVANTQGGSTVARSFTWNLASDLFFGTQPYIGFSTITPANNGLYNDFDFPEAGPLSALNSWRISGNLVIQDDGAGTPYNSFAGLFLSNIVIDGNADGSGLTAATFECFLNNARIGKAFNFPSNASGGGVLWQAESSHFGFLGIVLASAVCAFTIDTFRFASNCLFGGDVTISNISGTTYIGLRNCVFTKSTSTVVLNGGTLLVDTESAMSLADIRAGGTLTFNGGATLRSVEAPSTLFFGNTDIGAGAGSVFLTPGFESAAAGASDTKQLPVTLSSNRIIILGFAVRHNVAAGNGSNVTYELLINGASASPAVSTVLATNAVNQTSVTTTAIATAASRLSVKATKPGGGIASGAINPTVVVYYLVKAG